MEPTRNVQYEVVRELVSVSPNILEIPTTDVDQSVFKIRTVQQIELVQEINVWILVPVFVDLMRSVM